jgi:hypothetical protein
MRALSPAFSGRKGFGDPKIIFQRRDFLMKKLFKNWMVLSTMVLVVLFIIGLKTTIAQPYSTFEGKVVDIRRRVIVVEGDKGEVFNFAVGRKTVYIPARLPGIGERVKVEYLFIRGRNVAYHVQVITSSKKK